MVKYAVILFLVVNVLVGQNNATIQGVVYDAEYQNEPLAFANVLIEALNRGVTTDLEGKYILEDLDSGVYEITFTFIGYSSLRQTVEVNENQVLTLDVTLSADQMVLEGVEVSDVKSRSTETALLLEQKRVLQIKTAIGSSELTRKGVSNVADAVTNITGISKQQRSNNLFVRGLGDRYNTTTLNGLPMPSDNPKTKNPSLGLFNVGIVESIAVSKIYDPLNYADFSGANIDIKTKNYSGKPFLKIGLNSGFNTSVFIPSHFQMQSTVSPSDFGFKELQYPDDPLNTYNFQTWNASNVNLPINFGLSVNAGRSFSIGNTKLNTFFVASHGNNFAYSEGILRGGINKQGVVVTDLRAREFNNSTNTTLMGNFSFIPNVKNNLKYNVLFINASSQDHNIYEGIINFYDAEGEGGLIRRSTFERTTLLVNQLLGHHEIGHRFELDWGIANNLVNNKLPDRIQNMLIGKTASSPKSLFDNDSSNNHRFYQDLQEEEWAINIFGKFHFANQGEASTEASYKGTLTLGYSGRFKQVNFEALQFNFDINQSLELLQPNIDVNNLDAYFNKDNFESKLFKMVTYRGQVANALDPEVYSGSQMTNAFLGSVQFNFTPKLSAIVGLRVESVRQELNWETVLSGMDTSDFNPPTYLLPNLSLKYKLNEQHNIKLGMSNTYTFPQFKERSPYPYKEITQDEFGNPDLYASTNYNLDIKWEYFPSLTETFSMTLFGKLIQNPINASVIASATNDISYINTGDQANILGSEIEVRKLIFEKTTKGLYQSLRIGVNLSGMITHQDLNDEKVRQENELVNTDFTNTEATLTGAPAVLLNTDITYKRNLNEDTLITGTLFYSYFSDKLLSVGTGRRGNQYDEGFHTLNANISSEFNDWITLRISVSNIINPNIRSYQDTDRGDLTVLSFKNGATVKFGASFRF